MNTFFEFILLCSSGVCMMCLSNLELNAASTEDIESAEHSILMSTIPSEQPIGSLHRTDSSTLRYTDYVVKWQNIVYPIHSDYDEIDIPNGSALNFASDGVIGATIRAAQKLNNIPNPNGITHSGFVIYDVPTTLFNDILKLQNTPGTDLYEHQKAATQMLEGIAQHYPEVTGAGGKIIADLKLFCVEAVGTVGEVLDGIYPHVHIQPLETVIEDYDGAVFLRPLTIAPLPIDYCKDVVTKYLGRKYESPFTISEMVSAIRGGNKTKQTDRLFCSELTALFYQDLKLIDASVNVSNVVPEQLCSKAGKYDLLARFAGPDIKIKKKHGRWFCGWCW